MSDTLQILSCWSFVCRTYAVLTSVTTSCGYSAILFISSHFSEQDIYVSTKQRMAVFLLVFYPALCLPWYIMYQMNGLEIHQSDSSVNLVMYRLLVQQSITNKHVLQQGKVFHSVICYVLYLMMQKLPSSVIFILHRYICIVCKRKMMP